MRTGALLSSHLPDPQLLGKRLTFAENFLKTPRWQRRARRVLSGEGLSVSSRSEA